MPDYLLNMMMVPVRELVVDIPMDVGVTDGAHTITIAVMISMITALLVMVTVVVVPVLAGVMKPVPIMVIVAQMLVICA